MCSWVINEEWLLQQRKKRVHNERMCTRRVTREYSCCSDDDWRDMREGKRVKLTSSLRKSLLKKQTPITSARNQLSRLQLWVSWLRQGLSPRYIKTILDGFSVKLPWQNRSFQQKNCSKTTAMTFVESEVFLIVSSLLQQANHVS